MSSVLTPPDLTSCEREMIHTPGAIQPHGMMFVMDRGDAKLLHVAGDIEGRLGVIDWMGQPLGLLVGNALGLKVAALNAVVGLGGYIGQFRAHDGEVLDVSTHYSDGYIIVELETASVEALSAASVIDSLGTAAAAFERATTVSALCERAAVEFRRLTGFDRVMVYRFLDDDAGQVVAESRREDLHSFLDQHFPASDIPLQARALYVRNRVRVIPDAAYAPIPLRPAWTSTMPLDMADSSLRSVAPVHLAYLANMGVRASASFSIVKDGMLWGLVACHHETPRSLTFDVRGLGLALASSMGRWIKAKDEAEVYRERLRLRALEDGVVALLSREGTLDGSLSRHLDEIGSMLSGSGVAILRGCELVVHGTCPVETEIRALAGWLANRPLEPIFATSSLSSAYAPAEAFLKVASGLLAVTLSAAEPWLLMWFRAEQIEELKWAGNPYRVANPDPALPLTPRASFEAWLETVPGQARAWSQPEIGVVSPGVV